MPASSLACIRRIHCRRCCATRCCRPWIGTTFGLTGDAQKEARAKLVAGPLTKYLGWLQDRLQARGGEFFASGTLTIADLKVFVFLRGLMSGQLDHVPTDLVQTTAPALGAFVQRIAQTPAIAQYYAKSGR